MQCYFAASFPDSSSLRLLALHRRLQLNSLPPLPSSLYSLDCIHVPCIVSLPALPRHLVFLRLIGCTTLVSLPTLPCSLQKFMCGAILFLPSLRFPRNHWNWSSVAILTLSPFLPYLPLCETSSVIVSLSSISTVASCWLRTGFLGQLHFFTLFYPASPIPCALVCDVCPLIASLPWLPALCEFSFSGCPMLPAGLKLREHQQLQMTVLNNRLRRAQRLFRTHLRLKAARMFTSAPPPA